MRLIFSVLALTFICFCFCENSVQAQLIRISPNGAGGVNIRAPFVRVNTSPYGNTHVRAPFVNLNSPPPAYYQPPYYQPTQGTAYGNYAPGQIIQGQPAFGYGMTPQPSVQPGIGPSQIAPSQIPLTQFSPPQTGNVIYNGQLPTNAVQGSNVPTESRALQLPAEAQQTPTEAPQLRSVLQRGTFETLPPPINDSSATKSNGGK